jgi:hypothetical protein
MNLKLKIRKEGQGNQKKLAPSPEKPNNFRKETR